MRETPTTRLARAVVDEADRAARAPVLAEGRAQMNDRLRASMKKGRAPMSIGEQPEPEPTDDGAAQAGKGLDQGSRGEPSAPPTDRNQLANDALRRRMGIFPEGD